MNKHEVMKKLNHLQKLLLIAFDTTSTEYVTRESVRSALKEVDSVVREVIKK